MRTDDLDESENVEDRRGMAPQAGMVLGGGGLLVLILALLFGIDPQKLMGPGGPLNGANAPAGQGNGGPPQPVDPREEAQATFTKKIFGATERVWTELFAQQGRTYTKPTLVLYSGYVESACGGTSSAVGPFYCPGDSKVYIDLGFYKDMQDKLNAPGDFARAYVVAHEVGHHVQRLLGYGRLADEARQSGDPIAEKQMSVRMELQADYLAGVWANRGQQDFRFLEEGDIDTALNAAHEIGDDTLERKATGRVRPETFTHGTSKQRMGWFTKGFKTGDVNGAKELFDRPYNQL